MQALQPWGESTWSWITWAWRGPTNVAGYGWGGLGVMFGATYFEDGDGNGHFMNHPFVLPGYAITVGNTVSYSPQTPPWATGTDGNIIFDHERQHIIQHHYLGPFYLPLHGVSIVGSYLLTRSQHEGNPLEWGPHSNPPQPWPPPKYKLSFQPLFPKFSDLFYPIRF
jgi:hypothetical protein